MNVYMARARIAPVLEALSLALGDESDEQLVIDTLEGETDLFELVRGLLNSNQDDGGQVEALKQQIADRTERKERAESRIKHRRETIADLMEMAGLTKLPLPEATLSLRQTPPKPAVPAPDLLPDDMCRIERKPDMEKIKDAIAAGQLPAGVILDNGGRSLTVRTK